MGSIHHNTIGYNEAALNGYKEDNYPYKPEFIPTGTFRAKLDFKIWSKKVCGINCCFSCVDTNQLFQITVYWRSATSDYKIKNSDIDFVTCPLNRVYLITIKENSKGNPKLFEAELL